MNHSEGENVWLLISEVEDPFKLPNVMNYMKNTVSDIQVLSRRGCIQNFYCLKKQNIHKQKKIQTIFSQEAYL